MTNVQVVDSWSPSIPAGEQCTLMEKGRQLLRSESGGGDEGGIYSVTTGQYVPTVKVVPHVLWQHYDHVIDEGRFAGRYA